MNQAGYFETKQQFSPTTLAMIVALHVAAIGTAILWKVQGDPTKPLITHVTFYPVPKDPDPIPQPPRSTTIPKTEQVYVPPKDNEQQTPDNIDIDWPKIFAGTGGETRVEPDPPLPPATLEPARARGDVRTLITPDDYPDAARRHDETGTVRARLEIGANGRVTGCSIVASSGSTALDSATCRVLKARAHFSPAKDSSGQTVADSYVTPRIVWKIESDG